MGRSETHWDKATRCQGKYIQRPGRTHECQRQAGHEGKCSCICTRTWGTR